MKKTTTTKAKDRNVVARVPTVAFAPPAKDRTRLMELKLRPGQTESLALAEIVTEGTVGCSATLIDFTKGQHDGLSLTEVAQTLRAQGDAVVGGDLSDAERMLNAQAVTLNAIFNELARRAATNMGTYLETTERYLRLAMKAQAQCRATVEALAEMKNPHPVAFVKQANIAHGNQQVNNGGAFGEPAARAVPESARTHAGNSSTEPSKLLEATDVERLDTGAQSAAGAAHQDVETVGALNRPDDRGG
jgi:hypothetical protein